MQILMTELETDNVVAAPEEAILLRELSHRAANDLAVAFSALRVAASGAAGRGGRAEAMRRAEARLGISAALHRLLARSLPATVDIGAWMGIVCDAAAAAAEPDRTIRSDLPQVWLDGLVARRVVLIGAELIENAFKYGMRRGGSLSIGLAANAERVRLRVMDDGPGFVRDAPSAGGGLGSGIVADLVTLGAGRMDVETEPYGTSILVEMPTAAPRPADRGSMAGGRRSAVSGAT